MSRQGQAPTLVTGANGFVGSHCVKALLEQGGLVRGTVRDPKAKKNAFLWELPGARDRLELVKADLRDPTERWRASVRGCAVVMHTASPVEVEGRARGRKEAEEFFIKPAVEGTEAIIRACIEERVRRVVLTSSVTAVAYGHQPDLRFRAPGPDEENWTNVEGLGDEEVYYESKTLAEKAAWNLVKGTDVELATVNPGLIVGPILSPGSGDTSQMVLRILLNREYPLVPAVPVPIVDVRDVARMHLLCADTPEAAGRRHIACATPHFPTTADVSIVLHDAGYSTPTTVLPLCLMQVASVFDARARLVLDTVGKDLYMNPVNGNALMGSWMPWEQSVVEMAESMVRLDSVRAHGDKHCCCGAASCVVS